MISDLLKRLTEHCGAGFSVANLKNFRQFYLTYSDRAVSIGYPSGSQLATSGGFNPISSPSGSESPSGFHPNLSWSHYRALMRVENIAARQFYETEAVESHWSRRDLERQIGSLFYERLMGSTDKTAMLEGVRQEAMPINPMDMQDPYVLEFLDLPNVPQLQESQLEQAIIDKLQHFLLELGRGFSFVARQKRMRFDDKDFYVDLVFYNYLLKCFVLIDLKNGWLCPHVRSPCQGGRRQPHHRPDPLFREKCRRCALLRFKRQTATVCRQIPVYLAQRRRTPA